MDFMPALQIIWERSIELFTAPYYTQEMLWILIPLVANMLLMELYFGRYTKEELGWNTAFSNSLVLIFVSIDLLRQLYYQGVLFAFEIKTALVLAIILEGIILTGLNFFHVLPKKWSFSIASKLPINIVAYFTIILIYTNIQLDLLTGAAIALSGIGIYLILKLFQMFVPESSDELFEEDEE